LTCLSALAFFLIHTYINKGFPHSTPYLAASVISSATFLDVIHPFNPLPNMTIFEHLKKLQLKKLHMSPHPIRPPSPTPQSTPHSLKVSRDFVPTPASIALLRKNDGIPPFTSFTSHKPRISEEVYLDSSCQGLVTNGILVRLSNGVPEALVRDVNNRFLEYDYRGDEEVEKVVASAVPGKHLRLQDLLPTVVWYVHGGVAMPVAIAVTNTMSKKEKPQAQAPRSRIYFCCWQ
jgi:hypothetical protein